MREDWANIALEGITIYAIGGDWGKAKNFPEDNFELAYCIRGSEFRNWNEEFGNSAVLRKLKHSSIAKRNLMVGDILVEISGGGPEQPVGRTEVISNAVLKNFPNANVVCTNFLRLLRTSHNCDSEYVNYYLKLFYNSGKIKEYQAGSNNLRNLKFNKFLTIEIPLPPLPEQRAIVAKIEQLFTALDQGIADLQKAQEQLKTYRQAVLKKAFEGELTKEWREQHGLDFNWVYDSFQELGEWRGGGTPSKRTKEFWENGNVLWVSPKDMKVDVVNDTQDKITEASIVRSSAKWIEKGSVLFVVRSGIIRRTLPLAIAGKRLTVNQDMQSFRPSEQLYNLFVFWYCKANDRAIRQKCAKDGTTVDNINVPMLKKYKIPLPPLEEQHQIVQQIESRLSVCDKIEQSITENLEKAKALRQSILKKAFEGNLLTKEELAACKAAPDYEPASVLLERIKAEKNAHKAKTKKKSN